MGLSALNPKPLIPETAKASEVRVWVSWGLVVRSLGSGFLEFQVQGSGYTWGSIYSLIKGCWSL